VTAPDHSIKVTVEVHLMNTDKLMQTEGELVRLISVMTVFKTMQ
jgi:hypothetical protein